MWRWLVLVSVAACAPPPPPPAPPHCYVTVREPTSVMSNGVNTIVYKQRTYPRAGRCADAKDVPNRVTCLEQDDEADHYWDESQDERLFIEIVSAPFVLLKAIVK